MNVTLTELERAINHWRAIKPSCGEERALSAEVNTLATVYAQMIFDRSCVVDLASLDPAAQALLTTWLQGAPSPA